MNAKTLPMISSRYEKGKRVVRVDTLRGTYEEMNPPLSREDRFLQDALLRWAYIQKNRWMTVAGYLLAGYVFVVVIGNIVRMVRT